MIKKNKNYDSLISWNYRTVVTYKKDTSYKWLIISRNFIELNEKIIRTFHYFIVSNVIKCDWNLNWTKNLKKNKMKVALAQLNNQININIKHTVIQNTMNAVQQLLTCLLTAREPFIFSVVPPPRRRSQKAERRLADSRSRRVEELEQQRLAGLPSISRSLN